MGTTPCLKIHLTADFLIKTLTSDSGDDKYLICLVDCGIPNLNIQRLWIVKKAVSQFESEAYCNIGLIKMLWLQEKKTKI